MYSQPSVGLIQRPANEGLVQTQVLFCKRCSPIRQLVGQRRRWESNPLLPGCSRLPGHLAPASNDFGIGNAECGLASVQSAFPNSQSEIDIARPGIEPGLRPSQSRVQSATLTGCFDFGFGIADCGIASDQSAIRNPHSTIEIPCQGIEPRPAVSKTAMLSSTPTRHTSISTWNRTRTWMCDPLHHRDVGRRLDLHQHQPVYETGA